jgi:hypothetical protein
MRGALCLEIGRNLFGDAPEIVFECLLRSVAGAGGADRKNAIGVTQAGMQRGETAHRQSNDMRPVDACCVHQGIRALHR